MLDWKDERFEYEKKCDGTGIILSYWKRKRRKVQEEESIHDKGENKFA